MFGLPKSKDLGFLLGRELIQVCIGLHQVILVFDCDTSISLECDFYLAQGTETTDKPNDYRSRKTDLSRLLGSHITNVNNRGGGELAIDFSDGSLLRILDSNSDHESYQISHPTETIVV